MHTLLDVIAVEVVGDYGLKLDFENGEKRLFDMTPYLVKKPFEPLKQKSFFSKAKVVICTVAWPGGIDISPATLYDKSIPLLLNEAA